MRLLLMPLIALLSACTNHLPPPVPVAPPSNPPPLGQQSVITLHIAGRGQGVWTYPDGSTAYVDEAFGGADPSFTVTGTVTLGFVPGQGGSSTQAVEWNGAMALPPLGHLATFTADGLPHTITVLAQPSGNG